jgi:hypothetical protein
MLWYDDVDDEADDDEVDMSSLWSLMGGENDLQMLVAAAVACDDEAAEDDEMVDDAEQLALRKRVCLSLVVAVVSGRCGC